MSGTYDEMHSKSNKKNRESNLKRMPSPDFKPHSSLLVSPLNDGIEEDQDKFYTNSLKSDKIID